MIKASELRIGNHIKRRRIDDVLTVDLELLTKVQRMPYLFEPVPLTEQWFLDNGFTKRNDGKINYYVIDDDVFVDSKPYEDGSFYVYSGSYEDSYNASSCVADKKYVHEIENLYFALTNNELETLKGKNQDYCKCKEGPRGRTVTEDFEHQVCDRCGLVAQ